MKRTRIAWLGVIGLLLAHFAVIQPQATIVAEASTATTYTMTFNAKRNYVRTQDAYLPAQTLTDLGLDGPQDIFIDEDDLLYVADTGNRRIVRYNIQTGAVMTDITHPDMQNPKGIFVTDDSIYIASASNEKVVHFTKTGTWIETFGRPTSPSFGTAVFNPSKIAVDNRGNMYIQGDGISDGIIQLASNGEFLGFFTSNKVRLSATQEFLKLIFSEEQFNSIANRDPSLFSSVFIDQDSTVYTTTMNTSRDAIKKHNTAGGNIFQDRIISTDDARDIVVDDQGIIYAAMDSGLIFIYSADGDFIFNFGANAQDGSASNSNISGVFRSLAAIAVDSRGYIWAADDDSRSPFIQAFRPTDYSTQIYNALTLYQNRDYEGAIAIWKDVLQLNQMSVIAHDSIGKNYLQSQQYDLAMVHFELAGNRSQFSDAFWEVRNMSIQALVGPVLLLIVLWILFGFVWKRVSKLEKVQVIIGKITHFVKAPKLVQDLSFASYVMRHPQDGFYEIKRGRKGSLIAVTLLFVFAFTAYLTNLIGNDFIFQYVYTEELDFTAIVVGFFAIAAIFIISNYLDTSIHDGEGTIKHITYMVAYALVPYAIAAFATTILSYVMTYNEVFILDFMLLVGVAWTAILLFIGVSEIHNYTIKQTIKSLLITILFVIIGLVVAILLMVVWTQVYLFLEVLVKEVWRNVTR